MGMQHSVAFTLRTANAAAKVRRTFPAPEAGGRVEAERERGCATSAVHAPQRQRRRRASLFLGFLPVLRFFTGAHRVLPENWKYSFRGKEKDRVVLRPLMPKLLSVDETQR